MLYGEITRQHLKLINAHVVADTIDYLEMKFSFQTADWSGLEKWAHFANGDTVYDIRLTNDCIRKEDHLNLSAGIWKVYLHGNEFADGRVTERITTNVEVLRVLPTGTLTGEPFPEMPASVTEQILARLENIEQNGGGVGNTDLPIYTLEWMQSNYPDLIKYYESDGAYVIEFILRNDDMSLNPPDGMYMLWPQKDALASPVFAIRILIWDVEKDSYVMLKGFSDYGYLSMIRGWTNNSNILGQYSISTGAFVDVLTINSDGTFDYTDYDFVSGQYVEAQLAKTLCAPNAPVVGEVVVVKSLNEDGTVKETETVPMAGGNISVTYDDTTGELTIASSAGGVAYDEETGNLTIGG